MDDVTHGGLAYDAGIGPGMKIIAVNGKQYSPDEMKQAIAGSKLSTCADSVDRRKRRAISDAFHRLSWRFALASSGARQQPPGLFERNSESRWSLQSARRKRHRRIKHVAQENIAMKVHLT